MSSVLRMEVSQLLRRLGHGVVAAVIRLGYISRFFAALITHSPGAFRRLHLTLREIYFSGVLFLICVATCLVASRTGEPPDLNRIKGLTFDTLDRAAVRASWDGKDVAATAVVLALVAALYLYFSFWIG